MSTLVENVPSRRAVLIAGPTGSGKSRLALALSETFGSTIVNADSMQVYEGLRVLTARPNEDDEKRRPHRLYGTVPAGERFSVGRWLRAVARTLSEIPPDGPPVLLVGGSGLYFKALTQGLVALPDIEPPDPGRFAALDDQELHAELADKDAQAAARLAVHDRQRVLRALHVLESTGRSLLDWQSDRAEPLLGSAATLEIVLDVARDELYRRIDARFEEMMGMGAVEEVAALLERQLDPTLPLMKAVGLAPLARYLGGTLDKGQAVALGQRDTRRYAKRQLTFFRNQLAGWTRLAPDAAPAAVGAWMGSLG